jgi:hypothetical protein
MALSEWFFPNLRCMLFICTPLRVVALCVGVRLCSHNPAPIVSVLSCRCTNVPLLWGFLVHCHIAVSALFSVRDGCHLFQLSFTHP